MPELGARRCVLISEIEAPHHCGCDGARVMFSETSFVHHSGFACRLDGHAARRQLRMSLSVVTVLAVGIASVALTFGRHPIEAKRDVVSLPSITTLHAESNAIGAIRG